MTTPPTNGNEGGTSTRATFAGFSAKPIMVMRDNPNLHMHATSYWSWHYSKHSRQLSLKELSI
jgi:hypothetical protein